MSYLFLYFSVASLVFYLLFNDFILIPFFLNIKLTVIDQNKSFFFRIVLLLYYLFLSVLWRFLHLLFIFTFAQTFSSQTTSSHPFNFYLKKKIQTFKTYLFPANIIRCVAFCGSMFDILGRIFWEKTVSPWHVIECPEPWQCCNLIWIGFE